ncbi:MAG TPA: tetratricopeptide repeat protein [Thermoplasmata archaeon]
MPGKTARALCPVCQEPMPPDETECGNCGAFVIDEAVVRLSRAFGIDREKALQLFEKGFRHPKQLAGQDVDDVLTRGENGLLFLCTNCGGFVAKGDARCPRCAAEFEVEPEVVPEVKDILDLVLCPVCGADNGPEQRECEICGEPLNGSVRAGTGTAPGGRSPMEGTTCPTCGTPKRGALDPCPNCDRPRELDLEKVDAFLQDLDSWEVKGPAKPSRAPVSTSPQAVRTVRPAAKTPRTPRTPKIARLPARGETPGGRRPRAAIRRPHDIPAPKAPPKRPARSLPPHPKPAKVTAAPTEGVRRRRTLWTPPPAEFTGAVVTAAAASLYLSNAFVSGGAEIGVAWGVAFVLAALSVSAVQALPSTRDLRAKPTDYGFLAAGVLAGWLSLAMPVSVAPALIVFAAIPLALATRRIAKNGAHAFLVVASALGLLGFALAMAVGLEIASTVAWNLGLLAYAPWPAILLGTELRRVRSSRALRQELARAERDVGRRDYAQSLAAYDRAIELTRKGTSGEDLPWYGKGATLVLLGRYEDALRAIDRALDINPYNEVAWLNKGNALMRLGRHTDALRCFNAALRVNPRYEVAWNNKGNALARMGRYEEALRCYEKALTIDPRYRGSWVNKGYVLTKLGRYKEAASCADRALRLERRRSEPA